MSPPRNYSGEMAARRDQAEKRSDRPACASVSPAGDQCVLFAGHSVDHSSAIILGRVVGPRWSDLLNLRPKTGALAAVEHAALEVAEANRALDRAMSHALDYGNVAAEVAAAGHISRATLFRRLATS